MLRDSIISKRDALDVLNSMKVFEKDLTSLYNKWSYPINENIGRKNIFLSLSQEREVCKVLSKKFTEVCADGSPGKADITISDLCLEIECKLTSGSRQKSGNVSYSFYTDWDTICNKGSVDYIFILASSCFNKFAFLYFEKLTSEDFFPPASGSRGKSRMRKYRAMKKCNPLVGGFISKNKKYISNLRKKAKIAEDLLNDREKELEKRKTNTEKQRKNLDKLRKNAFERYERKINRINKNIEKVNGYKDSYTFILEEIE